MTVGPGSEIDAGGQGAEPAADPSRRPSRRVASWPSPVLGPRHVWHDVDRTHVLNGVVGAVFSMTGPVAVILTAADRAGLSTAEVGSWIFGVFFLNGLLTILASWLYRQPLAFFWTIPGTVLVGQAATHLPWAEVVGAYVLTAVLLTAVGVVGRVDRLMRALPMPVVMAMVAGVFLSFGTGMVAAVAEAWAIAVPMVLAFLAAQLVPRIGAWVPPIVAAVVVGVVAVQVAGASAPVAASGRILATPVLQQPAFSWAATAELVVPLAVTVLFVQNAQGMAVLSAAGHAAPMRFSTIACGLWSLPAAAVGGVTTCLTGPTNALLTASGRREGQYVAGLTCGLIAVAFGLTAPAFVDALLAMPAAFIAVLAGLALLRALSGAFAVAFAGPSPTAPLLTFLVTVAGVDPLNLGAPFWGLVAGLVTVAVTGRLAQRAEPGRGR